MTNKTLLVLAAGMGSRYGGLKQIDGIGPNEEAIIEYSVYDAIKAGFNKVVFIIRRQFEEAFKDKIASKMAGKIDVHYVYQEFDVPVGGKDLSSIYREKPWGTAHALLMAKEVINEPFAVINADDYYGKDSFGIVASFMDKHCTSTNHGLIGYVLKNTLSEHGQVNRGVCKADASNNLESIKECLKIRIDGDTVKYDDDGTLVELSPEAIVSMNFWAFHPSIFQEIEDGFLAFAEENKANPKAEYFIPLIVDDLIKAKKASFAIVPTNDQWFGVTYQEDKPMVVDAFSRMAKDGVYPANLWS